MRVRYLKSGVRHAFYGFCRQLCIPAVVTLSGVRYFNVPDITRIGGGLLIASNHQSYLDPVLVAMALGRPVNFAARSSLFRTPGFSQLIRALGARPLRQGQTDRSGLKTVIALLRSDEPVLIFPEGTRTRDGTLGELRAGVGSLAVRCGVPLLPACVEGAYRCWPRHRALPRPARIAVAFGELLSPEGRSGRQLTEQLSAEIRKLHQFLLRYLRDAARS